MTKRIGNRLTATGLVFMVILAHSWVFADPGPFWGAATMGQEPVSSERLLTVRGMNNPVNLANNAGVQGNQINYQGNAEVQQSSTLNDSFNQSRGVFTVVQNSGNNVMIQTYTIVNVNFK